MADTSPNQEAERQAFLDYFRAFTAEHNGTFPDVVRIFHAGHYFTFRECYDSNITDAARAAGVIEDRHHSASPSAEVREIAPARAYEPAPEPAATTPELHAERGGKTRGELLKFLSDGFDPETGRYPSYDDVLGARLTGPLSAHYHGRMSEAARAAGIPEQYIRVKGQGGRAAGVAGVSGVGASGLTEEPLHTDVTVHDEPVETSAAPETHRRVIRTREQMESHRLDMLLVIRNYAAEHGERPTATEIKSLGFETVLKTRYGNSPHEAYVAAMALTDEEVARIAEQPVTAGQTREEMRSGLLGYLGECWQRTGNYPTTGEILKSGHGTALSRVYNMSLSSAARDAGIPEHAIRRKGRGYTNEHGAPVAGEDLAEGGPETAAQAPKSPDLEMVRRRDSLRVFVSEYYGAHGKLPDRERLIGAGYLQALESYQGSVETVARDAGIDIFAPPEIEAARPAQSYIRAESKKPISPEEALRIREIQAKRQKILAEMREPKKTASTQRYLQTRRYATGQRIRHDIGPDGRSGPDSGYGPGRVLEILSPNTMLVEFDSKARVILATGHRSSLRPSGMENELFW